MIRGARAQRGLWLAFLLPAFVLRSLVPMGFMPMFGPGFNVGLMMCDGYAPVMRMNAGMDMSTHATGSPQSRCTTGSPIQRVTARPRNRTTAPAPMVPVRCLPARRRWLRRAWSSGVCRTRCYRCRN